MITPRTLKGFRDFLPEKMIPKKEMIRKLETIFESFGFSPIDTPALEYTEILLGKGGGETDKQIYRFNDNGGRDVSMRFDLTVPLARFISQYYNQLNFPFKRYHIGPVWRGENTSRGRFREFYQCDFDILGSDSVYSDLEILKLIQSGLKALDCGTFVITVNNRMLLNGILDTLGLVDKSAEVLRSIDKIYKIGYDKTLDELSQAAGISKDQGEELLGSLHFTPDKKNLGIRGEAIFETLENFKKQIGEDYQKIADDLIMIFRSFEKMGVLDSFAFNPTITRGLDYYTGIVFESFFTDFVDYGSVCSGGRYDNLTALYSKNQVAGVGASFGLDRILAMMEENNLLEKKQTVADLLIFNLDEALIAEYFVLADKLRKHGIKSEVVLKKQKIGAQFKQAEKKGITFALIAGDLEIEKNLYNLKNIKFGEEKKLLTIEQIIHHIQNARS